MNKPIKGSDVVAQAQSMAGDLPANYAAAKKQLALVEKIDECKDWADKAAALASYARQSDDKTLMNHAMKIKARAIRRCGELLKQYDDRGGDQKKKSKSGDAPTSAKSQREAAEAAGLSKDQQVTAVRVAEVPADLFEAQVDSDDPPTVTALAEQGKKKRTPVVNSIPKEAGKPGFLPALHLCGTLRDLEERMVGQDPAVLIDAMRPEAIEETVARFERIFAWAERFVALTERGK